MRADCKKGNSAYSFHAGEVGAIPVAMNRILPLIALAILSVSRPGRPSEPPAPFAAEREIASLFPERCRVYVEAPGLEPLLRDGHKHPFLVAWDATPLGQALGQEGLAPGHLLTRADAWLGEPVLPLLKELTRRGLALGIDPEGARTVLVSIATDGETARRVLSILFARLERQFGLPGALRAPHADWEGAEVWFLGDGPVVARRGELVVLGNDRDLVAEVLERANDPRGRGLQDRPGFRERQSGLTDATLWAWLEMEALEAYGDEGLRELRRAGTAPAAQGLLGAGLSALCGGRTLAVTLALDQTSLTLRVQALGAREVSVLSPGAREGALPADVQSSNLGSALLYRDYGQFLTRRAELFPVEAQSRFAETITTGALFFGGRDLGTEVLPHLSPWIRLVSRPVDFATDRRPEIPLPGVAAIAVLDDAREGEAWVTALQSLIAILGVEQAQKGEQGLRLLLSNEEGIELTSARFPAPRPEDGIDLRYNLEPAMAVVGRHLVVGTHATLVRQLARELRNAEPRSHEDVREHLRLDPHGLAALVAQNREPLIAQKMLSEGLEHAAAARETERLRLALASLESLRLEVESAATNAPAAVLVLTLRASDE